MFKGFIFRTKVLRTCLYLEIVCKVFFVSQIDQRDPVKSKVDTWKHLHTKVCGNSGICIKDADPADT